MEDDTHPYVKLAKTPLAQQTTICGIPAKHASIVVAVFALVVISGSHLAFGALLLKYRWSITKDIDYARPTKSWLDMTTSEVQEEERQKDLAHLAKNLLLGIIMGFCSGVATAVTAILILVGAFQVRPQCFMHWFFVMIFALFFGRLVPSITLFADKHPYAKYYIILSVIDIVTAILLVFCWGQLSGVARNEKYLKLAQEPHHNIKSNDDPRPLLPPGSYPRQDV